MKTYMIILDGAADRVIEELGGKTPLDAANKPVIDEIAKRGSQSMISIIDKGIVPESDSGTMALLSYNPLKYYPGRGTLEGLGTGMVSEYNFHASFRINFASYDAEKGFLDRRTARGLSNEELQKLAQELREGICLEPEGLVQIQLIVFGHHRGILSLVSDSIPLSGNVSNTDPGFSKEGCFSMPVKNYSRKPLVCMPLDGRTETKRTAEYINLFMKQASYILENSAVNEVRKQQGKLPANCILVRDGGIMPNKLPQFFDKFGWSLMMFGQLPSEKAIADLTGAEFTYTRALELQMDKEYLKKSARSLAEDKHQVVYIHLKGPDEPGHDGNPQQKVRAIEKIDRYFMTELVKYVSPEDMIIVTCDHATPCELGIHSADKVPMLMCGPGIVPDDCKKFSEKEALSGNGMIKKATDIFPYLRYLGQEDSKRMIENVNLHYILNSNAQRAVEAEVEIEGKYIGRASAPSAIIPGRRECWTGNTRGAEELKEMEQKLMSMLTGKKISQREADIYLRESMKAIGTNIALSVSVAFAKAAAEAEKVSLAKYLFNMQGKRTKMKIPEILVPVFSGGVHQKGEADSFQQIMVCIQGKYLMEAYETAGEISNETAGKLKERGIYAEVAASGGYRVNGMSTDEKLDFVQEILNDERWNNKITLAIDVAAEHLKRGTVYRLDGISLSSEEFYKLIEKYVDTYSVIYVEDPFDTDDTELWKRLKKHCGGYTEIIGDDLFATQKQYINSELAAGAVVKMNQVGTLSDTLEMIQVLHSCEMKVCVSHRSYETEDTAMCDLAVSVGAEYIKMGGVRRGERIIKYNQLLRLEDELSEIIVRKEEEGNNG